MTAVATEYTNDVMDFRVKRLEDRLTFDEKINDTRFASMERLMSERFDKMQAIMEGNFALMHERIEKNLAEYRVIAANTESQVSELRGEMRESYAHLNGRVEALSARVDSFQHRR